MTEMLIRKTETPRKQAPMTRTDGFQLATKGGTKPAAGLRCELSRRTFFRKQAASKQAAKGSAKITNYFAAVDPRHEEDNNNDGPKEGEQPEEKED
ncbi:hypothetical protein CCR75_008925 [Bremia lactucae]|uniref:Uncharacterized protein n=1 Tax=Bremia lactucae TaxID=4779 RepID=A0A976IKX7_BRELC|nr:hypothetical protein CCR75_008925 [Bremia lactucae]